MVADGNGRDEADGMGCGPSAAAVRAGLIERLGKIESRNALLAIDAVVSLLEPPYDSEMCVEAFLGVAEIVAGQRLLSEARSARAKSAPGKEADHAPC